MDSEAAHLTLGPHGDLMGLINKQNLMFKLSAFCKPVFQMKTSEKSSMMKETKQEREISPVQILRFFIKFE